MRPPLVDRTLLYPLKSAKFELSTSGQRGSPSLSPALSSRRSVLGERGRDGLAGRRGIG